MPICPNCGSWVDEGDSICSCGASVGGSSSGTENFEYEIMELYRQAHVFQEQRILNMKSWNCIAKLMYSGMRETILMQ